jgi:hypothetical protein
LHAELPLTPAFLLQPTAASRLLILQSKATQQATSTGTERMKPPANNHAMDRVGLPAKSQTELHMCPLVCKTLTLPLMDVSKIARLSAEIQP